MSSAESELRARIGDTITSSIAKEYFQGLLRSPDVGAQLSAVGQFFRSAGSRGMFSDRRREFVDMVLGVRLRCGPVFFEHLGPAVAAGVRPDAVAALLRHDDTGLEDSERRERDYILAVVSGTVTDVDYRWCEEENGPAGAVEYTAFILFLQLTIRMFQALRVPDPPGELVRRLLDTHVPAGVWPPGDE